MSTVGDVSRSLYDHGVVSYEKFTESLVSQEVPLIFHRLV